MSPRRNTVLLIGMTFAILVLAFSQSPPAFGHRMVRFASLDEVRKFLVDKSTYCGYGVPGTTVPTALSLNSRYAPGEASATPSHSETNNQVQGVDELDTVKTDGNYIYTVNGSNVIIVKAYPASEARLESIISINGTVVGIFVNGDKLAIFGQPSQAYPGIYAMGLRSAAFYPASWYGGSANTTIWIYNVQDRENPVLGTSMSVEGGYIGARMIGDFVYLITTQSIPYCDRELQLPRQALNSRVTVVSPQQVYHSDLQDYGQTFTNVLGFDITNNGENANLQSFILGTSGTIYVSTKGLYLTSPIYNGEEATAIHRISLDRETITYEATGQVPGMVLNQFSMDEYGDYFRVATHSWNAQTTRLLTTGGSTPGTTTITTKPYSEQSSGVYVLTRALNIIGRVEGLGAGEFFHSARFMGDRAYLVTFKKTDPLFVIDLLNPAKPTVLGELVVTGYSDYLQPYDENHIIGIGKETDDQGSFAWYMGVKIALFDVSDPANPVEEGRYIIGDRGTQSPALSDQKAVLFDRDRNLFVIPVQVAQEPPGAQPPQWGTPIFQGAYVFSISVENGVQFRGGITHLGAGETPDYSSSLHWVNRSLYVENVLYTVSPTMIKMNSLSDLQEINSISF